MRLAKANSPCHAVEVPAAHSLKWGPDLTALYDGKNTVGTTALINFLLLFLNPERYATPENSHESGLAFSRIRIEIGG